MYAPSVSTSGTRLPLERSSHKSTRLLGLPFQWTPRKNFLAAPSVKMSSLRERYDSRSRAFSRGGGSSFPLRFARSRRSMAQSFFVIPSRSHGDVGSASTFAASAFVDFREERALA